jgi:oxygen-dependent protoporphyrinogen oxidase
VASGRVAVVGGGISGLVAAHSLGTSFEVHLFESTPLLGGKVRTVNFRGRPVDPGPDSFIVRNPAAVDLARSLGLAAQLIEPASRTAAIWARGALRALPSGLAIGVPTNALALFSSGVVSPLGALRAAADLLRVDTLPLPAPGDAPSEGSDPSVAELLGPRLGREVLETLVDPLVGGINASDVAALSFAAALPQLLEHLRGARSVMRGLRPLAAPPRPGGGAAVFAGLQGGIGTLVDALVTSCRQRHIELRTSSAISALRPRNGGWRIEGTAGEEDFDGVVLALPAPAAAPLLEGDDAELAEGLALIPYAGVVTVTFAYPLGAVPEALSARLGGIADGQGGRSGAVLPGSGVLVPRRFGALLTAASFTSTKWPRSAAPGEVLIRASAGRHGDERALGHSDDELAEALRLELSELLGLQGDPLQHLVSRYPTSFPQYVKGHLEVVRELRRRAALQPPLVLTGAAYDGIGIPACIGGAELQAGLLQAALRA